MRIATYNVEWFANLFDDRDRLLADDEWSGRQGVRRGEQIEALAKVFTAINADAVLIIEAPNTGHRQKTERALETFAGAFDLRTRQAVIGFANDTHQEIALLFDPDRLSAIHDPQGDAVIPKDSRQAPRFDGSFRIDLDIDGTEDVVRFSKPPLELRVETRSGMALRMIGAHLKSKAPHGAKSRDEIMRLSIANRRKQLAQAIWLRERVRDHMDNGDHVILLGDLNDGPGLDEFESLFGRSSVEILLAEDLYDPHASGRRTRADGPAPATARFTIDAKGTTLEALLDYVMISPGLMARRPEWRIWHPFHDPACRDLPELQQALLTASDHFPVTLDVDI